MALSGEEDCPIFVFLVDLLRFHNFLKIFYGCGEEDGPTTEKYCEEGNRTNDRVEVSCEPNFLFFVFLVAEEQ